MTRSKIQGKWAGMQTGITHDPENRPDSDFYETAPIAVAKLLEVQDLHTKIWEPACGAGAISWELTKAGHIVWSSDLFEYDAPGLHALWGADFLGNLVGKVIIPPPFDIVTNPPFSLALEFAQMGLEYLENGCRIVLLNRLAWLESQGRRSFFENSPLRKVWVFSKRLPMMHRPGHEGTKIKTGTVAYAWFVWEKGYTGEPEIGWL